MAKQGKRKEKDMPATAEVEVEKTKPVRLELSPGLHKRLRVQAAKSNRSMASLARSLVAVALDDPSVIERAEQRE